MKKQRIIGILGGGEWGTALGKKLSQKAKIKIYSRDLKTKPKKIGRLNYFYQIEKLKDSNLIIIAVPSFAVREVFN